MKKNISNKTFRQSGFKTGRYIKLFVICCLLFLFSCKAKKPLVIKKVVVDTTTVKTVDTRALKLNAIRTAQTFFNTFSGKARTKLDIDGNSNDVTLNIRIKRDQKIWVSITAIAGIEVARALITPDSIMLINRLQDVYIRQPFSYVIQYAGSHVNYKTLESLLIGNVIPEVINENSAVQTVNAGTSLTGNLSGLAYKVTLGADLKAGQLNLDDQTAGQSMQVNNSAFIQLVNRVMPSQIDMASIVKSKKILVNLHYVKEDFDQPLDFPFSIPARYKPAE
jgi:hypothetical protein